MHHPAAIQLLVYITTCWVTIDMSHRDTTSDTTVTIHVAGSYTILATRIEKKRCPLQVTIMWSTTGSPGTISRTLSDMRTTMAM